MGCVQDAMTVPYLDISIMPTSPAEALQRSRVRIVDLLIASRCSLRTRLTGLFERVACECCFQYTYIQSAERNTAVFHPGYGKRNPIRQRAVCRGVRES